MPMLGERLSPRHRECLRLVFERHTSKEIAAKLGIGVGTVDSYISEAVALLGAQNRRRAAEILFASNAHAAPGISQGETTGVAQAPASSPIPGSSSQPGTWLDLLPLRISGAKRNEFKPIRRLFWILQIAFALAISFGMLVTGLEVVSRLFAGAPGP